MALFANQIIILKDGIPDGVPALPPVIPVIEQQAEVTYKITLGSIQCNEFIDLSKQNVLEASKQSVSKVKTEISIPTNKVLPNISVVRHPDFIQKTSAYMYHMFKE